MKLVTKPLNQRERFIVTNSNPEWKTIGPRKQQAVIKSAEVLRELDVPVWTLPWLPIVTSTWHKKVESMTIQYEEIGE